MKESVKTSLKAVWMIICLFAMVVTASGAISYGTEESPLYIIAAVFSMAVTALTIFREIKRN